jgi:hypothetical protein
VQFRNNDVSFANSYHSGLGPGRGTTPEKTLPFGVVGLTSGVLRITKFGSAQYDRKLVMVDEVAGERVPGVMGAIVRGNRLRYDQRIAFPPSAEPTPKDRGEVRMHDVVIDRNTIEHARIGIQLGPQVRGALLHDNHFEDVARSYAIASPAYVQVMEATSAAR